LVMPSVLASDGLELAWVGISSREMAEPFDMQIDSALGTGFTCAPYYPGSAEVWAHIFAERGSGRIVGGAFYGKTGTQSRVTLLGMAIKKGLTVSELMNLETAFMPNVSDVPEAVVMACDRLRRKLARG